jgi:hypothetical protein
MGSPDDSKLDYSSGVSGSGRNIPGKIYPWGKSKIIIAFGQLINSIIINKKCTEK